MYYELKESNTFIDSQELVYQYDVYNNQFLNKLKNIEIVMLKDKIPQNVYILWFLKAFQFPSLGNYKGADRKHLLLEDDAFDLPISYRKFFVAHIQPPSPKAPITVPHTFAVSILQTSSTAKNKIPNSTISTVPKAWAALSIRLFHSPPFCFFGIVFPNGETQNWVLSNPEFGRYSNSVPYLSHLFIGRQEITAICLPHHLIEAKAIHSCFFVIFTINEYNTLNISISKMGDDLFNSCFFVIERFFRGISHLLFTEVMHLINNNSFIYPLFRFISKDDYYFLTMGMKTNSILCELISECWEEKEIPRHTFQHYFIIIFIVNIENNISDGYDTIVEERKEMGTDTKEFRDPIYNFIHINNYEKKIIESPYFQRLRYIHQLGMTYFVYPGAQHTRFDHSLGTMEIATRLFDVIKNKKFKNRFIINSIFGKEIKKYRQILRVACLLHDIGHYPFSHASESDKIWGMKHEQRGKEIILDADMRNRIENHCPSNMNISAEVIALLIDDKHEIGDAKLELLRKIITRDLGVDRIDYLIRDSLHTGVKYGLFDCHRLIDTFILSYDRHNNPELCLEKGGIHAAEGLIYARYWIFLQVYFHKTRVAYDLHLGDYTKKFVEFYKRRDKKPIDFTQTDNFLKLNDFILLNNIYQDSNKKYKGKRHEMARIIMNRQHHKRAVEIDGNKIDSEKFKDVKPQKISESVFKELKEKIEDKFYDEIQEGKILFKRSATMTNKFEQMRFLICDKSHNLTDILDESKLIDSLKSIDLFRVYVARDKEEIVPDISKIGEEIQKNYYFVRRSC